MYNLSVASEAGGKCGSRHAGRRLWGKHGILPLGPRPAESKDASKMFPLESTSVTSTDHNLYMVTGYYSFQPGSGQRYHQHVCVSYANVESVFSIHCLQNQVFFRSLPSVKPFSNAFACNVSSASCNSRPVASGRHRGGQKKYKSGRNFWKQILTDNFIYSKQPQLSMLFLR